MAARKRRRRVALLDIGPVDHSATDTVAEAVTRDPDTFDYGVLASELKVQAEDARARLKVVDARMQQYGLERENLYRYLNGVETALGSSQGAVVPTSSPSRF